MRLGKTKAVRGHAARREEHEAEGPSLSLQAGSEVAPTFLIVGVMKGGTSSLHWYLGQHPEVFVTPKPHKELHYFDQKAEFRRAHRAGYLQHFAAAARFPARGESTPSYCFVPEAAAAIAAFEPRMRLIMMLRDPAHRAISHIEHRRREAVRRARKMTHGEVWDELLEDLRTPYWRVGPRLGNQRGYHARGHYHEQLRRLYEHFPREQVLVVRLEDLQSDPQGELGRVTGFLGIAPHRFEDLKPHNVNPYEPPDPEVYDYLSGYYRPHNQILTRDFGIRTDDWRTPGPIAVAAPPGSV